MNQHPAASASSSVSAETFQETRERLLEMTVKFFTVACTVAIVVFVLRARVIGWQAGSTLQVATASGLILLYPLRRFLSYRMRAAWLISMLSVNAIATLLALGLLGVGIMMGMMLVPVLLCMFWSGRAGLIGFTVATLVIILVGTLWVGGQLTYPFDVNAYLTSRFAWQSVTVNSILMTSIMLLALSRLLTELAAANQTLRANEAELHRLNEELALQAATDSMTGIWNRGHFVCLADQALRQAQRYGQPLTMLMLDIDHFKKINDTYGHAAGDTAIKALVAMCQRTLRDSDFIGRLGGEEFGVVLPQTPLEHANTIAERLREETANIRIALPDGRQIGMTASIGLATASLDALERLMAEADRALYAAKNSGRNRVVRASAITSS